MEKNIMEMEAVCYKCKKKFSTGVQFFYDSVSVVDKGEKFASIMCPYCGAEDDSSSPFLFYSKNENILYTVFSSPNFNSFARIKLLTEKLLEYYLSNISFKEQAELRNAKKQYIEKELFLNEIKNDHSEEFILGAREIRFTPPPQIMIEDKYCFLGNYQEHNLSKNDIAFSSSGLSPFQINIILEACKRMNKDGFTVKLIDIDEERKPSVTCGFLSIVLTVGSLVVVPILVNVISDIINEYRHKKENNEPKLKKNDSIEVTIYEDRTNKVYFFEGNPDNVVKVIKECGHAALKTLSLKNCHIALAIDNIVADVMFPSTYNHQTFNEIAKEYQKVFHPNSVIEIKTGDEWENSEEIICYKASLLMNEGDYKDAYWMLRPYIDVAQNMEFFYNFAFCLSHLDVDKQAIFDAYAFVIKKYLARADLKDLESFGGNIKQRELNRVTREMVEKKILEEDDEGIPSIPDPKTEEEIRKTKDICNGIKQCIKNIQIYEIEDLKQEAYFNSKEIQLSEELRQIESFLHILLSTETERKENELDRRLKDDESDNSLENKELLEQLNTLFEAKNSLQRAIEKVKKDRAELQAKQSE